MLHLRTTDQGRQFVFATLEVEKEFVEASADVPAKPRLRHHVPHSFPKALRPLFA